ncbi:MAG: PTS sugar transporter subunit IIA [Erysipelotrichaceae bacterium]
MNKDLWILVCTHGKFGEELIKSAEMIAGSVENVYSFSLVLGMSPEEYQNEIESVLKRAPSEVLCLVDLFGGTPSNTCACLSRKYEMGIISGLNLAMYIEITSQKKNYELNDLIECGLVTLKDSGRNVIDFLTTGKEGGKNVD